MFAIAKLLTKSILVGVACALMGIGLVGLLIGIPMAFLDFLPGENLDELRQLPRTMLAAGTGGLAIGFLAGIASQLTRQRVNYFWSTLLVAGCAWAAIVYTHPDLNINPNSTLGDYLESYRLTVLATLGGAAGVVAIGQLLRPFQERKPRSA
jgi:hypothetical protein